MSEILKSTILCIKNESTSLAKSEFAYQKLEVEGFYRGSFLGINVIFWKRDAGYYINIPKLFSSLNIDRKISDWTRLNSTIDLKEILYTATRIPIAGLSCIYNGGNNDRKHAEICGTYIHEKLIINIISWASIRHSLVITDMIINIHNIEIENNHALAIRQKDDKYEEVVKMMQQMRIENDNNMKIIISQNTQLESRYQEVITEMRTLNDNIRHLHEVIQRMIPFHELPTRINQNQLIEIVYIVTYIDDGREIIEFSRVQKRKLNSKKKELLSKHPDRLELTQLATGSSVGFVNKIREILLVRENRVTGKINSYYLTEVGINNFIRYVENNVHNNNNLI